jgi:hypothetical protein
MTGAEAAAALEGLCAYLRTCGELVAQEIAPIPGLRVVVGGRGERRGSALSNAEKQRRKRLRARGIDPDAPGPDNVVTPPATPSDTVRDTKNDTIGQLRLNGGIVGGSLPDSSEKQGSEREIPAADLSDHDTRDTARHRATPQTTPRDTVKLVSPMDGNATERGQVRRVFEAWRLDTGHHRAILDRKRGRRILARLREGFTPERLILAITNRRNDPWLMGSGGSPRVFDDIDQLLRDAAQVERLELLAVPLKSAVVNGSKNAAASLLDRARRITEEEQRAAEAAGERA